MLPNDNHPTVRESTISPVTGSMARTVSSPAPAHKYLPSDPSAEEGKHSGQTPMFRGGLACSASAVRSMACTAFSVWLAIHSHLPSNSMRSGKMLTGMGALGAGRSNLPHLQRGDCFAALAMTTKSEQRRAGHGTLAGLGHHRQSFRRTG
jgi:hypothetical protein